MKAITVKYFGPGNVRGSRYKATDSDRNSITLSADDSLTAEGNKDGSGPRTLPKNGLDKTQPSAWWSSKRG